MNIARVIPERMRVPRYIIEGVGASLVEELRKLDYLGT